MSGKKQDRLLAFNPKNGTGNLSRIVLLTLGGRAQEEHISRQQRREHVKDVGANVVERSSKRRMKILKALDPKPAAKAMSYEMITRKLPRTGAVILTPLLPGLGPPHAKWPGVRRMFERWRYEGRCDNAEHAKYAEGDGDCAQVRKRDKEDEQRQRCIGDGPERWIRCQQTFGKLKEHRFRMNKIQLHFFAVNQGRGRIQEEFVWRQQGAACLTKEFIANVEKAEQEIAEATHRRERTIPRVEFTINDEEMVAIKMSAVHFTTDSVSFEFEREGVGLQSGLSQAEESPISSNIYQSAKKMRESKSNAPIAEPPACPASSKVIPSAGDLYIHLHDEGSQIWLRSLKRTWERLPDDSGNAASGTTKKHWPQHPRPANQGYYLHYPLMQDSRPNWVRWQTIKGVIPLKLNAILDEA
ncbi:hypothetical protein CYLTODRAFT_477875 [Cylindrobasidium torrendii FP15055 ss-10]|uniref:Uncharacterized protein n=1 Tax=Cylindrobasidium torrendii FP15055 ss-10 TaxID=1314674 RepID=A0A0D7AUK8_9AGAR|nr:hypothetical protein CYLTODRAFT_477875 [Cylindrobasidium torrendii FP15055 ss-10]